MIASRLATELDPFYVHMLKRRLSRTSFKFVGVLFFLCGLFNSGNPLEIMVK